MAAPFVHLHVHSQYSLLDGAIRIPDLVRRTAETGAGTVAVTDHEALFGAVALQREAKKAGVRPILGAEIRVDATAGNGASRPGHLVLLAENAVGYRNLVSIVSSARLSPHEVALPAAALAGRTEGIIALTGCLGGAVVQPLLHDGPDAAQGAVRRLRGVLPDGNLFLEIQDHDLPEQSAVNRYLAELGRREGLPLVASNDAHYVDREDAEAYEVLRCIKSGRTVGDLRSEPLPPEMYLKTAEEMARALPDYRDALARTAEIAARCSLSIEMGKTVLPRFATPDGSDLVSYLRRLAGEGLARRLALHRATGVDDVAYRRRLDRELDVICGMDFAGYYLVVWDFVREARARGVPVGPGRGSGAGSLVAYALAITDLDPIEHKLLFERFLNPERVSMPDFDIDFCMDKRELVLSYLVEKYGKEQVSQIATFHELKSRSVVRDVGRALGMSYGDVDRIAKLVPPPVQGEACSVAKAIAQEPKLDDLRKSDPQIRKLLETAMRLEGLVRHAGMHAAGVVIADRPLHEYVPLFLGPAGEQVTQYDKDDVEKIGLVKFDLLGLTTLTVLDLAQTLVRARPEAPDFDAAAIPTDDAATFKLLQSGATTGVFQLEGQGMQDLFKRMKPDGFEDIVAAVALFRPGPLASGMTDSYVLRKHGKEKVTLLHPALAEILADTYGVVVYQEQVMQIASRLAGFSLGQADLLRRAMGKKVQAEMDAQRVPFVEGAVRGGTDRAKAEEIFDLMAKFGAYGFNRSHSAAYAVLAYRTAYLKAHYPVEFVCALLSVDKDKTEKLVRILADGRALGIGILPPDVNESDVDFKVVYEGGHGRIRFGLGAVKGVGAAALETVFEARNEGPFRDLFDFCCRVDLRKVTRAVLESLIKAGAFDRCLGSKGLPRARLFVAVDGALERGRAASRDRDSGQQSLFGLFDAAAGGAAPAAAGDYPDVPPWDGKKQLQSEREALGFYLSGHPLDRYVSGLGRLIDTTSADIESREEQSQVTIAGVVEAYRERTLRTGGGRMAYFDLDDREGRIPVIVFQRSYAEHGSLLAEGALLLVRGIVKREDVGEDTTVSVVLDAVEPLAAAAQTRARSVVVRLAASAIDRGRLSDLLDLLSRFPGRCPVSVVVDGLPDGRATFPLEERYGVDPSEEFIGAAERIFGGKVVEIR